MIEIRPLPIVLVALPPWEPTMPPLALARLTEYLRGRGRQLQPLDLNRIMYEVGPEVWRGSLSVHKITKMLTSGRHGEVVDELVDRLAESQVGVLGLSVTELSLDLAVIIARRVKERRTEITIIVGGPGLESEHLRQKLWSRGSWVDYCVVGEGEVTLVELLDGLEREELPPTPGVVPGPHLPRFPFEPREPIDLDLLPMPTFSDFDLGQYPAGQRGRCLPVQTSRGCVHRCAFCIDVSSGEPYRSCDPRDIADHLTYLWQNHQVESVEFVDLVLNGDPDRLRQWCELFYQNKGQVSWIARCAINEAMDADTLMAMRLAGCSTVRYGLESGSDRVLEAMGKTYTRATAAAVLRRTLEQGLRSEINLLVGFPGETEDDHQGTLDFLLENSGHISGVNTLSACRAVEGGRCDLSRDPAAYGIEPGGSSISFLDRAGNDAVIRNRRLHELLIALTGLGVPVRRTVDESAPGRANHYLFKEHTLAVRTGRLEAQSIEQDALRLEVDDLANRIILHADSRPMSEGKGIGAFLRIDDRYLDLTASRWTTWTEDSVLNLEAAFVHEPVRLRLRISAAERAGLDLRFDLLAERPVSLQEVFIGLYLPRGLRRYRTPEGEGSLVLEQVGPSVEERIIRAPTRLLVLSGEEDAPAAGMSLTLTDDYYWETWLIQNERGRRLMFKRDWDIPGFGLALEPGEHPLFRVRARAQAPDVRPAALDPRSVPGSDRTDFALVICPPWQNNTAPLWPAMLAGAARHHDFSGMCHDLNTISFRRVGEADRALWEMNNLFRWRKEESFETLWALIADSMDEGLRRILSLGPRVVGFSVTEASIRCSLRLAEMIKARRPDTKIVFGGPGIFWTFELDGNLAPVNMYDSWSKLPVDPAGLVDVYLRGEADNTFPLLLHCLLQGLDPLQVPGTCTFEDGAWRGGPPPVFPMDLNALPHPDFADLYVPSYGSDYMPLLTSRGCFRSCAFCNDCKLQNRYRSRSAEHVMDEIRSLHRLYRVDGLAILDLLLNGDLKMLDRLCDLMIDSGLPLRWGGQALIQADMDAALIEKMARAGCAELTFGLESLSQAVVDAMHKGFQVKDACRVMRECRAAGIETSTNFLVGFPGETPEMFQETLDVLRENHDAISRVQAINACHLTYRSLLWNNPGRYEVDTDTDEYWFRWQGPGAGDYAERKRRVRQLNALVDELGLSVSEQNLYDEGEEDSEDLKVIPSF